MWRDSCLIAVMQPFREKKINHTIWKNRQLFLFLIRIRHVLTISVDLWWIWAREGFVDKLWFPFLRWSPDQAYPTCLPWSSFPGGAMVKNLPATARDTRDVGLIPGWGRFPGGGNENPLQCSCLGNSMDRGAWRATVHGATKSQTQLSMHTHGFLSALRECTLPVVFRVSSALMTQALWLCHLCRGLPADLEFCTLPSTWGLALRSIATLLHLGDSCLMVCHVGRWVLGREQVAWPSHPPSNLWAARSCLNVVFPDPESEASSHPFSAPPPRVLKHLSGSQAFSPVMQWLPSQLVETLQRANWWCLSVCIGGALSKPPLHPAPPGNPSHLLACLSLMLLQINLEFEKKLWVTKYKGGSSLFLLGKHSS